MTEAWEFQPRVDKGCKLLDERLGPEWVEKIDLQYLDLKSDCSCILGQCAIDLGSTVGSYGVAGRLLFPPTGGWETLDHEEAERHGFIVIDGTPGEFRALTECWRQTILGRRAES